MQISTSNFYRQQTDTMQEINTKIALLQNQISSGKKVSVPSDDSVSFSEIALQRDLSSRLDQYAKNINMAQQRLSTEDNAITQTLNVMTRIQEISIQSQNDTYSASDRQAMAVEIQNLSDTILTFANSKHSDGSALFGGYIAEGQAFEKNADGSVTYHGDTNHVSAVLNETSSLVMNANGDELYMSISQKGGVKKSVFESINSMIQTLKSGKGPSADQADEITNAISHFTFQQTICGSRLERADSEVAINQQTKTDTLARLSALEDTDITSAISEMKQKMNILEASQSSFVKISQLSLFNYLK
ncbi:MAG: flagellar hook-associated protein 3 [Methylocystaceae bacterium]|nr:flagellar hook-associated protein 3 [Methylocystaceae bacterium]